MILKTKPVTKKVVTGFVDARVVRDNVTGDITVELSIPISQVLAFMPLKELLAEVHRRTAS